MSDQTSYWHYWGKADTEAEARARWHPFAYHSLDVAAVATALLNESPTLQRILGGAFDDHSQSAAEIRAWIHFFFALHDIGKLHALFQIKAP